MSMIKAIVVHLLFVALFLFGIEWIASMVLLDPSFARPVYTGPAVRTISTWPLRPDPVTGWALAPPPSTAIELGREFQQSASGVGLRWLPGTMDMGPPLVLLVVGDDVAFGAPVPLGETFCGVIKHDTEERLGDRTMAVANAAVPGYDVLQMSLQFKKLTRLRPHLAIFCFTGGQGLSRGAEGAYRPSTLRDTRVKELLYRPSLCRALYFGIGRITGATELPGMAWEITRETVREHQVDDFEQAVREIVKDADRARIPLLLTSLGLMEPYRERLAELCALGDIAYIDGDQALLDHAHEASQAARRRGREENVTPAVDVVTPLDTTNEALAWWIRENLRPRMAPVFLSQTYFSTRLLPTRVAYRVLGMALSEAIAEGDLFSWRHRVLR